MELLEPLERLEPLELASLCLLTCLLPSNSTMLLPVVQLRSGVILLMGDPRVGSV
jgi:hypothetical protein